MDRLWSPWRSKYIESFANEKQKGEKDAECLFCDMRQSRENDKKNLVVYRGETAFVVLNLYPYNSGHLMIVPNTHTNELKGLNTEESSEMMALVKHSINILTETFHPHGFNLGMNIGRVSGAGIDCHIHFHIVPRWNGDTNFMPVLAETRVISESLEDTYEKVRTAFDKVK